MNFNKSFRVKSTRLRCLHLSTATLEQEIINQCHLSWSQWQWPIIKSVAWKFNLTKHWDIETLNQIGAAARRPDYTFCLMNDALYLHLPVTASSRSRAAGPVTPPISSLDLTRISHCHNSQYQHTRHRFSLIIGVGFNTSGSLIGFSPSTTINSFQQNGIISSTEEAQMYLH